MVKGGRIAAVIGLGLLGACTRPVDDPLAVRSIYWGLYPMPEYEGELPEVRFSAADTPAKQGYLYTSMHTAEVAAQYVDRALARQDEPGEPEEALTEVVYALEPAAAPRRTAADPGTVEGWAAHGYGLRRALPNMIDEIAAASQSGAASDALRQYGPRAAGCAENTLQRADRLLALSQRILAGAQGRADETALRPLDMLSESLNEGAPSPGEGGCGLSEAKRYLDEVTPAPAGAL
jgi:hypothetical protein